jgi:hypothetical protein
MTRDSGSGAQAMRPEGAQSEGPQSGGCKPHRPTSVIPQQVREQMEQDIQTMFAETAILLTHPDESRRALAKERVFKILFDRKASPAIIQEGVGL